MTIFGGAFFTLVGSGDYPAQISVLDRHFA